MTARPAFPSPDTTGPRASRTPSRLLRRAAFVIGAAVLGYGAFAIAFPAQVPA
ncbi:cytochrome-c peroxidase, partial [Burkholderia sp. Ac-20392]|nr:cytochrome-c peroxidase [Burkholderia sp. Ac-20392]